MSRMSNITAVYMGPPQPAERCRNCGGLVAISPDLEVLSCKPCGWAMSRKTYEMAVIGSPVGAHTRED